MCTAILVRSLILPSLWTVQHQQRGREERLAGLNDNQSAMRGRALCGSDVEPGCKEKRQR